MKAPGEAYDNPLFGKDPQPSHMDQFQLLPDTRAGDWGGVTSTLEFPIGHSFSRRVPLGEMLGTRRVTFGTKLLTKNSGPQAQFQDFSDATFGVAGRLYGASSQEQVAVRDAWREVGIRISGVGSIRPTKVTTTHARGGNLAEQDSLAELREQIDLLAKKLDQIARKVT